MHKIYKSLLVATISLGLFGCPSDKKVDPENLSTDLIGTYHGEVLTSTGGAKNVYDVEVTSTKTNEVNVKIESQYYFQRNSNEPFMPSGAKKERYFEDGKVTETKRFIVTETRSTDWWDYTTRTDINIEGKLTGKVLALDIEYAFPAYDHTQHITVNLDKK
jgi:hypothetical protein